MQELNDLRLVGGLHSGEAASLLDSILLIIWREVVKLTTCEGLASDVLILTEDANTTADGHSCAFVVTWWDRCEDLIVLVQSLFDFLLNKIKIVEYLPVIMMTRIPAALHSSMELITSLRGGSSMPTHPIKVKSVWRTKEAKRLVTFEAACKRESILQ